MAGLLRSSDGNSPPIGAGVMTICGCWRDVASDTDKDGLAMIGLDDQSLRTATTKGVRRQTVRPIFPDSLSPLMSDTGNRAASASRTQASDSLLKPDEASSLAKHPRA